MSTHPGVACECVCERKRVYECVRVCVASPAFSIRICLLIFSNLSVSIFLPVSLHLPLCPAHPVSVFHSHVSFCVLAWDAQETHLLSTPLLCPWSLSFPTQADHRIDSEKAHFVPDNDGAVPALCRGLLSKGAVGRGIWAVLWVRAAPQPWSLSSGLAFSS